MSIHVKGWENRHRSLLGPAWRWRLAQDLATGKRSISRSRVDEPTRNACRYLELLGQGQDGERLAERRYPEIVEADAIWDEPMVRGQVQLMVLGDCTSAEISERLRLGPAAIAICETLRFDVRPLLHAADWILIHVIRREADLGNDDLAAQMRLSYYGGPYACRALLDAAVHLPAEPVQQLYEASLLLHAKLQQALRIPLTGDQPLKMMQFYLDISRDEKQIQLEREKLIARMQRWAERVAIARSRLELDRQSLDQQGPGADRQDSNPGSPEPTSLKIVASPEAAA